MERHNGRETVSASECKPVTHKGRNKTQRFSEQDTYWSVINFRVIGNCKKKKKEKKQVNDEPPQESCGGYKGTIK